MSENTYQYTASTASGLSARLAKDHCDYFIPLLEPDFHVLDAGCGPGSITCSVATHVPKGSIIGIDASEAALEHAKKQSAPSNCSFQTGDLTALPFEDDTFDVVYTSQVLLHIPDVVAAFRELRRVCKPGGFVACKEVDMHNIMFYPEHEGVSKWQHATLEVHAKNHTHSMAGRLLIKWAAEAGFAHKSIEYSIGGMISAGDDKTLVARHLIQGVADEARRERMRTLAGCSEGDFDSMLQGFRALSQDETAIFVIPCGQCICYK